MIASLADYEAVYPLVQRVLEPSMSGLTEKALALHDLHEELATHDEDGWVFRSDLEREAHRRGVLSRNRVHDWAREFSLRGIWEGVIEGGRWKHRTIRDPREEPIQLPRPEDLPGTPKSLVGTSNQPASNKLKEPPSIEPRRTEANPASERLTDSAWEDAATRCEGGGNGSQLPNWDILGGPPKKCPWCGEPRVSCGFCDTLTDRHCPHGVGRGEAASPEA